MPLEYRKRTPLGAAPGTLVIDKASPPPRISLIDYGPAHCEELSIESPEGVVPFVNKESVTWIDVVGLGDEAILRELGRIFSIHPLVLEDVVHVGQRPRTEEYEDHRFIVARIVSTDRQSLQVRQISFLLGKRFLLTFQEAGNDEFEPIRDRLRKGRGVVRKMGPDFLLYTLLDSVIDEYFPVMERFGEQMETLEDEVTVSPHASVLARLHRCKSDLSTVRRAMWPQRDMVDALIREESDLIGSEVRVHLRDCHDHATQVMDMVDSYRDLAAELREIYMSSVANRTNEVMKVLTIVSTIFIPLSWIAGLYNMGFEETARPAWKPDVPWRMGYVGILACMGLAASIMGCIFWRMGWIGAGSADQPGEERS